MYTRAILLLLTLVTSVSASCHVCGVNQVVGEVNAMLELPSSDDDSFWFSSLPSPWISCGDLETAGINGWIPNEACVQLSFLVKNNCYCQALTGGTVSSTTSVLTKTSIRRRQREATDTRHAGDGVLHSLWRSLLADDDSEWTFSPTMAPTPFTDDSPLASPVMIQSDDEATSRNNDEITNDTNDDEVSSAELETPGQQLDYDSEPLQPENFGDDEVDEDESSDSAFEMQMLELDVANRDSVPTAAPVLDLSPISPVVDSPVS